MSSFDGIGVWEASRAAAEAAMVCRWGTGQVAHIQTVQQPTLETVTHQ